MEHGRNIETSYHECFGIRLASNSAAGLHKIADKVWNDLYYNRIPDLPNLGQGQSDFRCFNDVLKQAVGTGNCVSRFIHANPSNLRRLGHGSAAARWKVEEMNEKVKRPVDVFD